MEDDNLSTAFSVDSSISQLSIATTANQTVLSASAAATIAGGEVEMQPLPGSSNVQSSRPSQHNRTANRRSALEPYTTDVPASDSVDGGERLRNTSNSTFTSGTTIIDEQHANYVLMYDMLTGIRISVFIFAIYRFIILSYLIWYQFM